MWTPPRRAPGKGSPAPARQRGLLAGYQRVPRHLEPSALLSKGSQIFAGLSGLHQHTALTGEAALCCRGTLALGDLFGHTGLLCSSRAVKNILIENLNARRALK